MSDPDLSHPGVSERGPAALQGEHERRRLRLGGKFIIALGAFLLVLMGTITWRMAPQLLVAPEPMPDGSRFNASADAARMVLELFGSIMLFGGITVALGLNQVRTGMRPRRLLYLPWAAAGLILVMTIFRVLAIKEGQA